MKHCWMILLLICPAAWASVARDRAPLSFGSATRQQNQEGQQEKEKQKAEAERRARALREDEFLRLGTRKGEGGPDWQDYERNRTKDLIRSFIPPLLRPAFVGHAFVLPPNLWQISVSGRIASLEGNDFFEDGDSNRAVFGNFSVDRQFADLDLFYGFDLGTEWLHNFTVRLNIPYRAAQTEGFIHPGGLPLLDAFTEGSTAELGDIGLFVKKKFVDQAEWPIQIAGAIGLRFPTGSNREKFNDNGRIKVHRPDPTGTGAPPPPPLNMPLPLAMLSMAPTATTPFPFNNGVFGRFSDDGRLPSTLQPGTGSVSLFTGLFFTRVNQEDFLLGRSAFHWGATHTFRFEDDGIDPGDKTVLFASFVKPVINDLLSFDLSFVAFYQEADRYKGLFIAPQPTDSAGNPVGSFANATHVTFRAQRRSSFARGWTGFIAPSLILSPDPSVRITASALIRVIEPDLGPAPDWVLRLGVDIIF